MNLEQGLASHKYTGFDVLRTLAALGVVLTHSFTLTGHDADKPTVSVGRYLMAFGSLGVAIFFVISGFLVFGSWERSGNVAIFLRNRFARIWPALTFVVIISAFVLGPIVSEFSVGRYFSSSRPYAYVAHNLTLVTGPAYDLPGAFTDQPSRVVNGSLWTLPYEIWAYLGLLVLGILGVTRRLNLFLLVTVVWLFLFRFGAYDDLLHLRYGHFGVNMRNAADLGSYFLLGATLSLARNRISLSRLTLPGIFAIALSFVTSEPTLFIVGLSMTVIGLGVINNSVTARMASLGDPSYGIYIYSFPIQQMLVFLGITTSWAMFALSAPIAIAAGYASWHLLERPAMTQLKQRLMRTSIATDDVVGVEAGGR